ncbi:MAG: TlpA disulfide reductase family protein [Thiohalophilus sp.]|uniref:peroxiredoxin family protein n=1 Tax=Thiohalophilus sp. TaxID=3028392 RepID=UPI0028703BE1|nr:TlpA disulfide reductase family protein [Thiohalophilus sp.]MDR9436000.1 TlpA disulfide reductase family protein [Thiohalophilus sp.]
MKTRDKLIAVFFVLLIGALGWIWFSPSGLQRAPDISFKNVEGESLSLQQFQQQGRPVLVTFWATSCPGCIKEMPHLIEMYHDLAPRGLEIIGVAMAYDPPNHVMRMREEKNIPYPIVLDIDSTIARAFGEVKLTPSHFLINPRGRIVHHKIGELDMERIRTRITAMLNSNSQG